MQRDHQTVISSQAIDIGYFSTKVCFGKDATGTGFETMIFPSIAPRIATGSMATSFVGTRPAGFQVLVDGETYYVGSDVHRQTTGQDLREFSDKFAHTKHYKALLQGALHYIFKHSGASYELVLDSLILGLPVSTYRTFSKLVREMAIGEHVLSDPDNSDVRRRVTVRKCLVMMQPEGALLTLGMKNPVLYNNSMVLVVDVGGGTLDWFPNEGKISYEARSGSHNTAMLAAARAVANKIDPSWLTSVNIMNRIDEALRKENGTFVAGAETYRISDYQQSVDAVWEEGRQKMMAAVGQLSEYQCMFFTGGGARCFYDYMRRAEPKYAKIMMLDEDPTFANVKGFYLAGLYMARQSSGVTA